MSKERRTITTPEYSLAGKCPVMADFMKIAIEEGCTGVQKEDGGPFGAVVVKNGAIVARGHNMVLVTKDPTMHAEVTAIRNACKALDTFDLSGCQLYTSCYPCPMCMGASLWAKLDAVYYAATSKDAADAGFDDAAFHAFLKDPKTDEHRKLEPLTVPDHLKPFQIWNAKADKVPY